YFKNRGRPYINNGLASFLVAENEQREFVSIVRIQQVTNTTGLLRTLIVDSEKNNERVYIRVFGSSPPLCRK
ncbi:MAG: hypothetical protein LRY73_07885, partial [Bacillus sp. (in: Bacteria)]|nr:hypothetical protein [Bacillus sp. (in: firmicutes)]